MHGQTLTRHPPAVAVINIGTNDLGSCRGDGAAITSAAPGTAARRGFPMSLHLHYQAA